MTTANDTALRQLSRETNKGNLLHKIVADLRTKESHIEFPDPAPAPAAGLLEVEVLLEVRDGAAGDLVSVSDEELPDKPAIRKVTVGITGGSAAGKQLKHKNGFSAIDGDIEVVFVDGVARFTVLATGTGDVDLDLTDSQGHGLDVTDTATVTFS